MFLVIIPETIQRDNHLHRIYIALGIISNLQVIYSMQEGVHKSQADNTPLYRNCGILGGPWKQPPLSKGRLWSKPALLGIQNGWGGGIQDWQDCRKLASTHSFFCEEEPRGTHTGMEMRQGALAPQGGQVF